LAPDTPPPESSNHWLYKVKPGRGVFEVVLETIVQHKRLIELEERFNES